MKLPSTAGDPVTQIAGKVAIQGGPPLPKWAFHEPTANGRFPLQSRSSAKAEGRQGRPG